MEQTKKMSLLLQFSYLQILDVMTTLIFLLRGVKEANPFVRLALGTGGSPLAVLVAIKVLAVFMALYCVAGDRLRLLARVNRFFAVLVAWNLLAIILSSPLLAS